MKKAALLSIFISSAFWMNSCTICSCKKVDCPQYDNPSLDQWMKNSSGKEFVFINSSSAKDTFTILPIDVSSGYQANKGCFEGGDGGCNEYFRLSTTERIPNGNPKFSLSYDAFTSWESKTEERVNIGVKDLEVVASAITDTGFIFRSIGIRAFFQPIVTLNGKTFSNVQLIQVDTNIKSAGVYRIYFEKNTGLAAYEEYPSHELWIRQ